jgi:hypothetical protein
MHEPVDGFFVMNQGQDFVLKHGKIVLKPTAVYQFILSNQVNVLIEIGPGRGIQFLPQSPVAGLTVTLPNAQQYQKILMLQMLYGAFFQPAQINLGIVAVNGHHFIRVQQQHCQGIIQG